LFMAIDKNSAAGSFIQQQTSSCAGGGASSVLDLSAWVAVPLTTPQAGTRAKIMRQLGTIKECQCLASKSPALSATSLARSVRILIPALRLGSEKLRRDQSSYRLNRGRLWMLSRNWRS
jgi:hypothetical protein